MLTLESSSLIGRGLRRECYIHPKDGNKCIKVVIAGDDKAVAEAEALVPGIYGAAVKQGLGREISINLSPKAAHELIRKNIAEACRNMQSIKPVKMEPPYEFEIKVLKGISIEGYLKRPNVEKIDDRTVVLRSDNICDLPI